MKQTANRSSASQDIPLILWNPNVHYRIHKGMSPVQILSQINPAHASPSHFLNIQFNIILQSASGSSKLPHSVRSPHINLYCSTYLPYGPPKSFVLI